MRGDPVIAPMIGEPESPETDLAWTPLIRQLIVLVSIPVCFAFAIGSEDILPDKYFADSHHIQSLGLAASGPASDSFITMAWLYRLSGGLDYPTATAVITLAVFFGLVFRCVKWADIGRFGWLELVLFLFCAVEASIYLAQYSKESVIVLLALVLLTVPERRSGDAVFVALACGYAYLIRPYWFIVAALYLGFRILPRYRRVHWLPIFVVCAVVALAIAVKLALGVDLTSFRTVVNESNGLYAQSTIRNYLPVGGPVGASANVLLTLVLLVVPVPLVLALSPTYLVFGAFISVLWSSTLRVMSTGTRAGWFQTDVRLSRALSLLLAMLTVQAIFEPDYGSYIKHLTPLLPLFFLVLRAPREHRRTPRDSAEAGPHLNDHSWWRGPTP